MKKSIIKRAMKKRAKNYRFNEEDSGNFNNSYYFTAKGESGDALFFRVGYRSSGEKEVWAVYVDKTGKVYKNSGDTAEAGSSKFSYKGKDFEMDGEFTPTEREYEFTRDSSPEIFANLLARMKWTKGFDDGFKKIQQTHIEQLGKVTAKIKIAGKTISFAGTSVRDHSWGRRVWSDMIAHKWFVVTFEDGGCMCASTVNGLDAGYYIRDGVIHNAVAVKFNDDKTFAVTLTDGKRKYSMDGKYEIVASVPFFFQNGAYRIDEGVSSFVINGRVGYGITEFGKNENI